MEYRSLGRTGIQVSPLCLGAMMFGSWGEPDHDTSIATIHAAIDAGINFIDTADVYSQGDPNQRGNSRRWIVREVEQSLRRLNTDWIDLYQVHRPDPDTELEETLS